jgi:cytosine/adenosine deaminase-related metal-dependent hydrolase
LYRKFTADYIFTGYEILPGNFVLITNPEGVIIDIQDIDNSGDNIEVFKGLLTPGFINAHCHVELSYLKDIIPTGTGLVEFVQQVMRHRTSFDEAKQKAIQNAVQEMYKAGIVAVGDICNTTDSIIVKQQSLLHWYNFIEVSGFIDAAATKRLADINPVYTNFITNNLTQTSLSPHAPYSVSKTLFKELNLKTVNQLISIHNQECKAENELYRNKSGDFLELYKNFGIDISSFEPTGKTSLQSWLPYFNKNQSIISVHNSFTSEADIDFYKSRPTSNPSFFFCLCVNANKYIEQMLPPIELLRKKNCLIVIGTDSYASNWQLNILEEIKTIQSATANSIPLAEVLQWATINGARALQLENLLGSFEKNKKPGVVLIEGMDDLILTEGCSSRRIL